MRWPEIEALSLRLAFGSLAVFARSAGRWSVVVLADATMGRGVTVSAEHRERGRALLDALAWKAVEAGKMRPSKARTSGIGKRLGAAISTALAVNPSTKLCPRCGERKLVRLSFGRMVIGHACRACKWERPEAA